MPFQSRAVAFVAAVCLFAMASPGFTGTTGGVQGRALEATTNAPIAGASITATSPSQVATVVTDSDGALQLPLARA